MLRDITPKLDERVRQALSLRRPYRINLYHAPGAGGTTLAKRIIWNLHRQYPCVLYNSFTPCETIERISYFGITGHPVLAVIDGGLLIIEMLTLYTSNGCASSFCGNASGFKIL